MDLSPFKSIQDHGTLFNRIDSRIKTLFFLSIIIVSSFIGHWYLAAVLFIAAICLFFTLHVPKRYLLVRLAMPFGIAWLVFLSIMFTNGSHPLWVIMNKPFVLIVYSEGIQLGFLMMLRIMAAVAFACVLSLSTPMVEILETLRIIKVPGIMVDIADLMVRYVYLMDETAHNMHRAQTSRTTCKISWIERVRNTGNVAGYVMVSALDRSVRIYNSMLSRGYNQDSKDPVYFTKPLSTVDLCNGLLLMLFPIAILAANYLI